LTDKVEGWPKLTVEGVAVKDVMDGPVDEVNEMETIRPLPFTVTFPDVTLAVYPGTRPTAKAYVPFGSVKEMVVFIETLVVPLRVADQVVPRGRPFSSNNTGKAETKVTGVVVRTRPSPSVEAKR
jgi:hypothetical protein